MDNNDRLIRIRYALDIKNTDMVKIFKLGGIEVTKEEVLKILTKSIDSYDYGTDSDVTQEENIVCEDGMLDSFLNGFIIFKRGKQEGSTKPTPAAMDHVNNVILKKMKIALSLTSEDIIEIVADAGLMITKGELSALLRKEGHKNYKVCGDKYARTFFKGLALRYR